MCSRRFDRFSVPIDLIAVPGPRPPVDRPRKLVRRVVRPDARIFRPALLPVRRVESFRRSG